MKNIDFLDISISVITIMALAGLIWGHPSTELSGHLISVLWAGLVGLGLKKTPSTIKKVK